MGVTPAVLASAQFLYLTGAGFTFVGVGVGEAVGLGITAGVCEAVGVG